MNLEVLYVGLALLGPVQIPTDGCGQTMTPAGELRAAGPADFDESDVLDAGLDVGTSRSMRVRLDGELRDLALERVELLDEELVWAINGAVWGSGTVLESGAIRCYRGAMEGAVVFVSLIEDTQSRVVRARGVVVPSAETTAQVEVLESERARALEQGAQPETPQFRAVDLALEADADFHRRYGWNIVDLTRLEMLNSALALDFIYQRELGIRYRVTFLSIWTHEPDPYYSVDTKDLVEGMQRHWNQYMGWVPRDTAHLLSGKVMGRLGATPQVGGNYLRYICDNNMAYSVSSGGAATTLSEARINLVSNMAHEQGHQWSSGHCSGNNCRIMCGDPGCFVRILEFEPGTQNHIRSQLMSVPCVASVPATLNPAWPDLIVTDIDAPDDISLGVSRSIGVRVKNVGLSRATRNVKIATWLSLDGDPTTGFDDLPLGGPGMFSTWAGVELDLAPGQSRTFNFTTFPVPMSAALGVQYLVAWVDFGSAPHASLGEANESNNVSSRTILVKGPDARVVSVTAPSTVISGSLVNVVVSIENDSAFPLDIPVSASIWNNISPPFMAFGVHPGEVRVVQLQVLVPPSHADCGAPEQAVVAACTGLAFDTQRNNDCMTRPVAIEDPAWDLHVELVNPPSDIYRGQTAFWRVRVTNVGNVSTPFGGAVPWIRTGIGLEIGDPNCWNGGIFIGGLELRHLAGLAAGSSTTFTFERYVSWSANVGTQKLKAGVDRCGTIGDFCHAGDNYVQRNVTVH